MKRKHIIVILTAFVILACVTSAVSAGLFDWGSDDSTTDESDEPSVPLVNATLTGFSFDYVPNNNEASTTDASGSTVTSNTGYP